MKKKTKKRKRIIKRAVKRARKNPVSTYIKVFRHGQGDKQFSQKGYFTGTGWNTEMSKAKKYSAGEAKKLAMQLKIPEGWGVAIVSG